jgi:hypothetical protein
MHIGKKIKYLVEHSDLPLQRISEELGYKSPQSLYDNYKREHVNTEVIVKACKLFKVSIKYFFDEPYDNSISVNESLSNYNAEKMDVEKELLRKHIVALEDNIKLLKEKLSGYEANEAGSKQNKAG